MLTSWAQKVGAAVASLVLLSGCPNGVGPDDPVPVAAASSIPTAAPAASGVDYQPPAALPGGPHTATGTNPFLAPPTADPSAEPSGPPFAPSPGPVPGGPGPQGSRPDAGGTPL